MTGREDGGFLSIWAHLATLVGAVVLQSTVIPGFGATGTMPDLVLVWVLAASVLEERRSTAFLVAAIGGFMVDLSVGRLIGLNLMLFIVCAVVARRSLRAFVRPSVSLSVITTVILTVFVESIRGLVWYLGWAPLRVTAGFISVILIAACYNALLMIIVHHLAMAGIKHVRWDSA